MHDLVVKGGTVVDGTGAPGRTADVAVTDGVVTEVGRVAGPARRTVEADGLLVTPGFVDIHTHFDGQATWDPHLTPSCWHGVTTAIVGNCGVGFAPVRADRREWLIELMEGVEDIPGSALAEGIRWDWETFPEYLDALDRMPRALDIGTHVPHAAVRAYVMGERAHEAATGEDLAAMQAILRDALLAGALGFSTGRTAGHRDVHGEPVPGTYAAAEEIGALLSTMDEIGRGVLELVPAGISGEIGGDAPGAMEAELEWILRYGEAHHRPITFLVMERGDEPDLWRRWFDEVRAANAAGADIHPQVGSRCFGMLMGLQSKVNPLQYRASYREVAHLPLAERVRRLRDPERRARILAEPAELTGPPAIDHFVEVPFKRLFPLGEALDYEPAREASVAAIAQREGRDPWEVLYDLLLGSEGRDFLLHPLLNYGRGSYDGLFDMMSDPMTVQGLGDGGAHCGIVCDASMTTYLLSHWARDRSRGPRLPVEHAVRRLTGDAAHLYGLGDRGVLAPGRRADLNLIDFDALALLHPELVTDLPAGAGRLVQRSVGYVETIVAGRTVVAAGELTDERPGRVVRGRGRAEPVGHGEGRAGQVGGDRRQRHVHRPPPAGGEGVGHRGGRRQPRRRVGHRVRAEARTRLVPHHEAPGHRRVVPEGHPLARGPLPPVAGDRHPHLWAALPQELGSVDAELLEGPRPRRLQHDVGSGEEVGQPAPARRIGEVDGGAVLAGLEQVEERAGTASRAVGSGGGLDLHHPRPTVDQEGAAQRSGPQRGEVDDPSLGQPAGHRSGVDAGGGDGEAGGRRELAAQCGDGQAEEHTLLDDLGGGSGRHGRRHGRPGGLDAQPGGDGLEVLRTGEGHGDPPVGGLEQPGAPAAAGRPAAAEAGQRGPLAQQRDGIDHDGCAEPRGPVGQPVGDGPQPGDQRRRGAERRPVRASGERHGAAARPRHDRVLVHLDHDGLTTAPTLSPRELVSLLRTAPHELRPALGAGAPSVALVHLDGEPPVDELPTVHSGIGTVLVGVGEASDPSAALCDVVLAPDDAALEPILAAVAEHPEACAALAGLLRGQHGRSIDDGLLAESAVYSALQAGAEHQAWRAANPVRAIVEGEGPPVLVERDGATLRVTLHRPERHNAFSRGMRDALLEALEVAQLDPTLQVELRGAGPSFCSGGDLAEFGSAPDPASAHLVRLQANVGRVLAGLEGRVVAHLHGACMGAGIELPAFGGHVIAAPDCRIALPELALGLIPGAGGTVSLPRRIGRQRTVRLALSGEALDAPTALAWGLVDEVRGG